MDTPAPTLGARYRLGPELGRGGMSTVYRAVDLETGREVAVKVYAAGASIDARARQLREAALGASLRHHGIVPLLDSGDDSGGSGDGGGPDGCSYLVTELVEGSTLRDRLAAGPCSADEVATLGARLASALGYLHEQGIVHRDVKPANVLLREDGDLAGAMLSDLGVAIRLDDARVTVEGSVVGTAAYLSPEQVSGKPITGATDIYSLGLVLIEALSGVTSYEGSGVECALARLHRQPVVPPTAPQWLAVLLTTMTAFDAADRPSAFEVELAFGLGETGTGNETAVLDVVEPMPAQPAAFALPDEPTEVLPVVARPDKTNRFALLVGAAVLALIIGVGLLSSGGSEPFPSPALTNSATPNTSAPAITPTTSAAAVAKHSSSSAPKPAAPKPPPKKHKHGH